MRNSKNKRKTRYPKLPKFQLGGRKGRIGEPLSSYDPGVGNVNPDVHVSSSTLLDTGQERFKSGRTKLHENLRDDINTSWDDGSKISLSTISKAKKGRFGKKIKRRVKEKFLETNERGNVVSKSTSRTNRRGVTRARGFSTDYETGKKKRFRGKYRQLPKR